jgi:NADPH2 dehydrogenase
MATSKLFQAGQIGELNLAHRIVLCPLTRFRSTDAHVPGPLLAEYYAQRASTPGTLLITEATFIAAKAGGYPNVPGQCSIYLFTHSRVLTYCSCSIGIWNEEQIAGWKKVRWSISMWLSILLIIL